MITIPQSVGSPTQTKNAKWSILELLAGSAPIGSVEWVMCKGHRVGTSAPAFARWHKRGRTGARSGLRNPAVRGRRRDIPPIAIENSGKSRLAAELPQLHPQASLFSGYISHQPPWRAGSGRLGREALEFLLKIAGPNCWISHELADRGARVRSRSRWGSSADLPVPPSLRPAEK